MWVHVVLFIHRGLSARVRNGREGLIRMLVFVKVKGRAINLPVPSPMLFRAPFASVRNVRKHPTVRINMLYHLVKRVSCSGLRAMVLLSTSGQ